MEHLNLRVVIIFCQLHKKLLASVKTVAWRGRQPQKSKQTEYAFMQFNNYVCCLPHAFGNASNS